MGLQRTFSTFIGASEKWGTIGRRIAVCPKDNNVNNAWEVNASTAHLDGHNLCSKSHNSPNDAFLGRNSSLSLDTRGENTRIKEATSLWEVVGRWIVGEFRVQSSNINCGFCCMYILAEIFSGRLCFRFLGAPLQDCQFRLGWRIGFRRWSLYEAEGEIRHLDTFGCYFWRLMVVFLHFCILLPCLAFNGTAYPYPISGKHISTPPGPASLEACHSWFESLWETQTRRADGGLGEMWGDGFRMVFEMGWKWHCDWCVAGGIGKPLVAVVLDEF